VLWCTTHLIYPVDNSGRSLTSRTIQDSPKLKRSIIQAVCADPKWIIDHERPLITRIIPPGQCIVLSRILPALFPGYPLTSLRMHLQEDSVYHAGHATDTTGTRHSVSHISRVKRRESQTHGTRGQGSSSANPMETVYALWSAGLAADTAWTHEPCRGWTGRLRSFLYHDS